jgi:hypothetical protein
MGNVSRRPYEYLHVCGDLWEGKEYHGGDKAVWTMSYARHEIPHSTAC